MQSSDKRQQWITRYLQNTQHVNILNKDFVKAYIKEFKAAHSVNSVGACRCEQLSKDLGRMYREQLLQRNTLPLYNMPWGSPRWIYCYSKLITDI